MEAQDQERHSTWQVINRSEPTETNGELLATMVTMVTMVSMVSMVTMVTMVTMVAMVNVMGSNSMINGGQWLLWLILIVNDG